LSHAAIKLTLPAMPAAVTPLVYVIVQFIAYHTATAMGKDVDQPRSIANSATVE
jgi:glucosamine--fructose-6-phosphate aminotransferase (isomerizing)